MNKEASESESSKCARCAVVRRIRVGRMNAPLCRDCVDTLSAEEIAKWEQDYQLDHPEYITSTQRAQQASRFPQSSAGVAMKERTNWAEIVEKAQSQPGQEIIVGDNYPGATRTYVKRRYGLGARLRDTDIVTTRGTLIVWWDGDAS